MVQFRIHSDNPARLQRRTARNSNLQLFGKSYFPKGALVSFYDDSGNVMRIPARDFDEHIDVYDVAHRSGASYFAALMSVMVPFRPTSKGGVDESEQYWDRATLQKIESNLRYMFEFEGAMLDIYRVSPPTRSGRETSIDKEYFWFLMSSDEGDRAMPDPTKILRRFGLSL